MTKRLTVLEKALRKKLPLFFPSLSPFASPRKDEREVRSSFTEVL
jgi:hypothetical protein